MISLPETIFVLPDEGARAAIAAFLRRAHDTRVRGFREYGNCGEMRRPHGAVEKPPEEGTRPLVLRGRPVDLIPEGVPNPHDELPLVYFRPGMGDHPG